MSQNLKHFFNFWCVP